MYMYISSCNTLPTYVHMYIYIYIYSWYINVRLFSSNLHTYFHLEPSKAFHVQPTTKTLRLLRSSTLRAAQAGFVGQGKFPSIPNDPMDPDPSRIE